MLFSVNICAHTLTIYFSKGYTATKYMLLYFKKVISPV